MKELKDYLHLYPEVYVQFIDEEKKVDNYGEFKTAFITGLFQNPAGAGLMAQLCCTDHDGNGWEDPLDVMVDEFNPILRPLSDMTEEEMKELYLLVFKRPFLGDNITHRDIGKKSERKVLWSGLERLFIYKEGDVGADSDLQFYYVHSPSIVLWQLSKHFDLFGLIEARLAIDARLLKTNGASQQLMLDDKMFVTKKTSP